MKAKFSAIIYLRVIVFSIFLYGCDFKPHSSTGPVILIPAESLEAQIYPTPTLQGNALIEETVAAIPLAAATLVHDELQSAPEATPNPPLVRPPLSHPMGRQEYVTDKMYWDLDELMTAHLPARDYLETHISLTHLARPEPNQAVQWTLGQHRMVQVEEQKVEVRLAAMGVNAYMWVDTRLAIQDDQFEPIMNNLDSSLYPAISSLFGLERRPGIDGDHRFHIVHIAESADRELGFFDSSDLYFSEVFENSNEFEGIFINLGQLNLGGEAYYGTLVHEIQHLIQWNVDRNEETWLDEGFSQLAEVYSGFNSFSVADYTAHNDIQLNDWSYKTEKLYPHYGGAALFTVYVWEQMGDHFVQTLVRDRSNGMVSVHKALKQIGGQQNLQTLFRDWLIAVYFNDPNQAEAKYGFSQYEFDPPKAHQIALTNGSIFSDLQSRFQFSGWYVELPSEQTVTVSFAGDSVQSLFASPSANPDGSAGTVFYAPPGNRLDLTLQKFVNLSGIPDPTISFDVWHDMEDGYDYAYLKVSADGGQNWEMLSTSEMKTGTYGLGFSNRSGGWVSQVASLREWSGQHVIIQFNVITDSAVPGNGFAVDNIATTGELAIADFEFDNGGWESDGFVRTGNSIPQIWTVSVVQKLPSGEVQVQDLLVDRYGEAQQTVSIVGKGVLVIAPVSPMTTTKADFWFQIE